MGAGALVYEHLPGQGSGSRLDATHGTLFVEGLHLALWVSGLALLAVAAIAAALLFRPRTGATTPIPTTHGGCHE